jgi:hypothetical protein
MEDPVNTPLPVAEDDFHVQSSSTLHETPKEEVPALSSDVSHIRYLPVRCRSHSAQHLDALWPLI